MRSYRVHSCATQRSGKIPYLVLSLCGRERVSIDMGCMQEGPLRGNGEVALTMEAVYELLQGKMIRIERKDGAIRLCPNGDQLTIYRDNDQTSYHVWMAEFALAWNMLSSYGTQNNTRLHLQ
jgi:hypothetical protein